MTSRAESPPDDTGSRASTEPARLARLDPRVKLAGQTAFALATFVHATPVGLAALTVLGGGIVRLAGVSVRRLFVTYRALLPVLLLGPAFAAVDLGPPWIDLREAGRPALASYRTGLLVVVGAAYVRTTTTRESEAAIAWLVPGRLGRLLAVGIGLVFRFLPLVRREVRTTKEAMDVRLGAERPLHDQMRILVGRSVTRLFRRADRLALALRARCLSWNPTYPQLSLGRVDLVGLGVVSVLVVWTVWPLVCGLFR